jgi:hypothetical protein
MMSSKVPRDRREGKSGCVTRRFLLCKENDRIDGQQFVGDIFDPQINY